MELYPDPVGAFACPIGGSFLSNRGPCPVSLGETCLLGGRRFRYAYDAKAAAFYSIVAERSWEPTVFARNYRDSLSILESSSVRQTFHPVRLGAVKSSNPVLT